MTQPEGVRRQIEEAKRLYSEVYESPPEDPTPEETPQPAPAPDASGQVHDWQKRFTNYKASADREISNLRQSVAGLQAQLKQAMDGLEAAKAEQQKAQSRAVPLELLTEEEKEMLGEENLAVVAKVAAAKAQAEAESLKAELKGLREQLSYYTGREQQRDRLSAKEKLELKMTEAFADWRKYDNDPAFEIWMREADPLTGHPRVNLFMNAQKVGDVARLAAFYREYGEKVGRDPREGLLQPSNRPGSETPQTKRIWSRGDIAQLYRDRREGVFNGHEAEFKALEADLAAAQREGRVR